MNIINRLFAIGVICMFLATPFGIIAPAFESRPIIFDKKITISSVGNTTNVKYWKDMILKNGDSEVLTDYTIYLSGNLTINSGGFLWLENSTLYLDSQYQFNRIDVFGTFMVMKKSIISLTGNGTYNFTFESGSVGLIDTCSLYNLGGNGLKIMSSNVKISKTSFVNTEILFDNTSATLVGCSSGHSYQAITAKKSIVKIINSTIDNAFLCLNATNSTVQLENTTLKSLYGSIPGSYDIVSKKSVVDCINSTFTDTKSVMLLDNVSRIMKSWFVSFYVNGTYGPLPNASVYIMPTGTHSMMNYTTSPDGWLHYLNMTEYVLSINNTKILNKTALNPYRFFFAAKGYLSQDSELNITGNAIIRTFLKETYGKNWIFKNEDWIVNKTTILKDTVMLLTGNLTIEPGGSLTLTNFTLLMNCTSNGTYGITVLNTGAFRIMNSFIKSYNSSLRYYMIFEPGSTGRISQSIIESVGYPGSVSKGLEIESSLVELYSSELRNSYYGMYINNSNLPLMVDNNIHNNDIDGIYLRNSSISTVAGEIYSDKSCGIRCDNSSVTLTQTEIRNNKAYAISSQNSSITIKQALIHDNNNTVYLDNSTCTINDNRIYNQKQGCTGKYSRVIMSSNRINNTFIGITFSDSSLAFSGNNVTNISNSAIVLDDSVADINSNVLYKCGYGMELDNTTANISSNDILVNYFDGIQITQTQSLYKTKIAYNLIMNTTSSGISIQDSDLTKTGIFNNRIVNNNYGISCTGSVLYMWNNSIENNSWYGIYSKTSHINSQNDVFIQTEYDIYITQKSAMTSENDIFSKDKTFVDTSSSWTVSWHVWFSVYDKFSTPANGSGLVVQDNSNGTFEYKGTTNGTGISAIITCVEFSINDGINVNYNPYVVTATKYWKTQHSASWAFNITSSTMINLYMPNLNLPPRQVHLQPVQYVSLNSTYQLTWSAPVDTDLQNMTKIYAYRQINPVLDNLTPIMVIYSNQVTTVYISNLFDNTDYSFRVRILDIAGQTSDSNEVSIKTKQAPPPSVKIKVTAITYNSVNLTWTQSLITDFLKYVVLYSTTTNLSNFTKAGPDITTQNHTNYTVVNLNENTLYIFMVKVYDIDQSNNTSSFSASNMIAARTGIKNHAPSLTSPKVTPVTGYTTSIFNFTVTYVDPDGDNPKRPGSTGYIRVNISGLEYDMIEVDPASHDFVHGKKYYFNLPYPAAGDYEFYFECNDGAAKYNYSTKTDINRFTVETPREIVFADLLYVAILLGMALTIFILLLVLWHDRRQKKKGPKSSILRMLSLKGLSDSIHRQQVKSIKREKTLAKDNFARKGVSDGRLKDIIRQPQNKGEPSLDDETARELAVTVNKSEAQVENRETYCGRCGAIIDMKVCGFCGASQKKYTIPERVPFFTWLLMVLFIFVPIIIWGSLALLFHLKGDSYFYPGHTLRLVLVVVLVVMSIIVLFIGFKLRVRIKQINKYGLIKCPSCAGRVNTKAKYCRHCGRSMSFIRLLLG